MNKKDELEMFVLDDVYEVIEIDFLDHKIKTVIDEYQNIWISVESICDHLKIDSEKEIESLIDSDLDVWILKVFDSNLGKYDLFMINIGSIKLWLNTIHFNHIKFGSRNILIKYIKEIVDIITNAAVVLSNNSICNTENNNEVIGEEVVFDKDSAIEKVRKQKEIKNSNIKEKIEIKNDETIDVVEVDFCDGRIELLKYCSDIWINVKSVCDLFGISYSEQHIKLESRDWKDWVIGKILNKKFVIHLYCFRDWLFKLDPSKLQEDKRNILIRYRKEVTIDAIQKAFSEEIKRDKSIDEVEDGTVKRDTFEEEKDEEMKEEKMSEDAMNDIVKMFEYEGEPLTAVTYKGQPSVIAKEFGKFLGYAKDGSKLVSLINDEWKKSFEVGKHFVVLKDKELKQFKELMKVNPSYGFSRAPHIMLLFRKGMYKTAFKSGKERAEPLIDFVVDEVFPQLEIDGRYDPNRNIDSIEVIGGEFRIPDDLSESLRLAAYLNDKRLEAEKERSLAIDRAERAENTIDEIAPLADWAYSLYSCSGDGKSIGKFAKSVKIGGVSYGKKKMFALLRELNILIDSGEEYNWPYQRYIDNNWLAIKSEKKTYKNGIKRLIEKVVIFRRGEMGIIGKVLNSPKYEGKSVKYNGIEMGGQMLLKNISGKKNIKKI